MIDLNKGLGRIRCNKYQYLIKKGSMSNYSFDILDENKTGILDLLFEKVSFPIEEMILKDTIMKECTNLTEEDMTKFIENLKEIEVFIEVLDNETKTNITLITDSESIEFIENKLVNFNYNIKIGLKIDESKELFLHNGEDVSLEEEQFVENMKNSEYVLVLSKFFQPDLFYKLNYYSIKFNKKMIISYLDGDEGVIVPIINPNKTGCYNDFEMLREASFHNLLNYQMMKEDKVNSENNKYYNKFYFNMLIDHTIVLINNYNKYSYINNYAYSLDFERMVTSKIRMLKFPKCPSCQGDLNLTHPFI